MQLLGNLRIHFLALVLTVVAEFIGIKRLGPVVFLPLLYALILGLLISIPKFKILTIKQMENSADYIGIAVMILMVKVGLGIGPNLGVLASAGWALDREPNVAIIIDKFGFSSPEGRGVMGMYICGVLIGAMWSSVLAGLLANTGWFHPLALAMGAGVGSASMMAAASAPIVTVYPEYEQQIMALAGAANLLTTVLGVYFGLFISLPIMEKSYNFFTGRTREQDLAEEVAHHE